LQRVTPLACEKLVERDENRAEAKEELPEPGEEQEAIPEELKRS
jgi:hypothetical protein